MIIYSVVNKIHKNINSVLFTQRHDFRSMASMTEADFGSDTDDDDYMPEGETQEVSEEENSGEDENNLDKPGGVKNKKKRKTKKKKEEKRK